MATRSRKKSSKEKAKEDACQSHLALWDVDALRKNPGRVRIHAGAGYEVQKVSLNNETVKCVKKSDDPDEITIEAEGPSIGSILKVDLGKEHSANGQGNL